MPLLERLVKGKKLSRFLEFGLSLPGVINVEEEEEEEELEEEEEEEELEEEEEEQERRRRGGVRGEEGRGTSQSNSSI
ncbi:hypothetical protein M8J77_026269 [Diaphorina citri]|nr:hypothetical protein M8J77_026269 [Diaphorina citri]